MVSVDRRRIVIATSVIPKRSRTLARIIGDTPKTVSVIDMTTLTTKPTLSKLREGVDLYRDEMRRAIIQHLKQIKGTNVKQSLVGSAGNDPDRAKRYEAALEAGDDPASLIDVSDFPHIVNRSWDQRFREATGNDRQLRNRMHLVVEARNLVCHPKTTDVNITTAIAYLDAMAKAVGTIGSSSVASQIEAIGNSLVQGTFAEPFQSDGPEDRATGSADAGSNGSKKINLKPWPEVIRPHPDVLNGEINDDTFAADLQKVADNPIGFDEYGSPITFFNRTYLTPGLKGLLANMLKRLAGGRGNPVIEMKTGFGGGKTHSLIALYHLAKSGSVLAELARDATDETGLAMREIFDMAGVEPEDVTDAKVAVLSGTSRHPADPPTDDGIAINTLWGYMAHALGGEAYSFVRAAAEDWTSPGGSQLDALFQNVGPCVILIDELVPYVRNLADDQKWASMQTFLQVLSESVSRSDNVLLVLTMPESERELGGKPGLDARDMIENVMDRVQTIVAPLETKEAFEVVRKRLFEEDSIRLDDLKDTAGAFHRMYTQNRSEYPRDASEPDYLKSLTSCYPIHPELFTRLFEDWSAVHRFQRTRGVLRLIAKAIKRLHGITDEPLIMPGSLRLDDDPLSSEFTRVLNGNWYPVLAEVDGTGSRADTIDEHTQRFKRYGDGAAKRIARSIFLGSVPRSLSARNVEGIDSKGIHLAVVQPGDGVPNYNEAKGRLEKELYHLHQINGRLAFRTTPNLTKVHQDVVARIPQEARDKKLELALERAVPKGRAQSPAVFVFPTETTDVPDDDRTKVVVLHPDHSVPARQGEQLAASEFAEAVISRMGDHPRNNRNTILFIATNRDHASQLRRIAGDLLAWEELFTQNRDHHLNSDQRTEAGLNRSETEQRLDALVLTAYTKLLWPLQPVANKPEIEIRSDAVVNRIPGELLQSAVNRFVEQERLVPEISADQFHEFVREYFWGGDEPTIEIEKIWNDSRRHVYMHRFMDRSTLEAVAFRLVKEKSYGLADRFDLDGDVEGFLTEVQDGDPPRFLVKPEAAEEWSRKQRQGNTGTVDGGTQCGNGPSGPGGQGGTSGANGATGGNATQSIQRKRLVASRTLVARSACEVDLNQFRDDVAVIARDAGGTVTLRIIIEADNDDGFDSLVAKTITQNGEFLEMDVSLL